MADQSFPAVGRKQVGSKKCAQEAPLWMVARLFVDDLFRRFVATLSNRFREKSPLFFSLLVYLCYLGCSGKIAGAQNIWQRNLRNEPISVFHHFSFRGVVDVHLKTGTTHAVVLAFFLDRRDVRISRKRKEEAGEGDSRSAELVRILWMETRRSNNAIGIRWMCGCGGGEGILVAFRKFPISSADFHFRFEFVIDDGIPLNSGFAMSVRVHFVLTMDRKINALSKISFDHSAKQQFLWYRYPMLIFFPFLKGLSLTSLIFLSAKQKIWLRFICAPCSYQFPCAVLFISLDDPSDLLVEMLTYLLIWMLYACN